MSVVRFRRRMSSPKTIVKCLLFVAPVKITPSLPIHTHVQPKALAGQGDYSGLFSFVRLQLEDIVPPDPRQHCSSPHRHSTYSGVTAEDSLLRNLLCNNQDPPLKTPLLPSCSRTQAMRACYILLAALTALVASANAAPSAVTNLDEIKLSSIASARTAPSPRSLSVHGNNSIRNRALRGTNTDHLDDVDSEDDLDDQEENEEERAGGTSLVKSIHKIKDYDDAKMLRQIAKGNEPEYILDKFGVAYKIINGERVYSIHDPAYARYLYWVKYHRDK